MKKPLFIFLFLSFVSCKKDATTDESIPALNIELHDYAFSLFLIGYDVLSSVDSTNQSALYINNNGLQIEWIDSLFTDGNGIEALFHFNNLDSFTNTPLYSREGKQRKGTLKFVADKPINEAEIKGEIEILDSYNFKVGYNSSKMQSVAGKLTFSKRLSQVWDISSTSLLFSDGGNSINLNKTIVFKNKLQGLWGNEITLTGKSDGRIVNNFVSEITEPLEILFTDKCSALYKKGKKSILLGDEKWIADFDGFNSPDCDRLVKLSIGRKEFYENMH